MDAKATVLVGIMIFIVAISGCTTPTETESPEQGCLSSGGTVATQMCCKSASDFPNTCLIGACGCSPENSKEVKVCDCGEGKCFNGSQCVGLSSPGISSFEECVAAGYPVLESYPRQCRTPDGQVFVEEIEDPLKAACIEAGGNWNECGSRCAIDNQGKEGIACPMMCEALCECGGIAGFTCPAGYSCKMPEGIADALGYCEPEIIGGQRDEYGCLTPAGYSWDSEVGACIRAWELDEGQKKAAKIAVAPYSFGVTVTQVEPYNCEGCFLIKLERNDNQERIEVELGNWSINPASEMPSFEDELIETQACPTNTTESQMALKEALEIAQGSECSEKGTLTDRHFCNSVTGTWWIDLEPYEPIEGCNPACVIFTENKSAEINWRCTGALP
ncbi:MAG: hypothetical protein JW727_05750 [Candidatus Aenigmarchaeota archaeon]|nr:hypothetical protein [Candidatus Aenigmarchaeota archaeon]